MELKNFKRLNYMEANDLWETTCFYLIIPINREDGSVDKDSAFLIKRNVAELVKVFSYLLIEDVDYCVCAMEEIYNSRRDDNEIVHEKDVLYVVNGDFYYPLKEYMDIGERVAGYSCDWEAEIIPVMDAMAICDGADLNEISHMFRFYVYRTLQNIESVFVNEAVVEKALNDHGVRGDYEDKY